MLHVFAVRSTFLTDGFASCSVWLDPPSSGSHGGSCGHGRGTPESRSFCGRGRRGGSALFACTKHEPSIVLLECCMNVLLHVLFEYWELRSCNVALIHWTSVGLSMWWLHGDEGPTEKLLLVYCTNSPLPMYLKYCTSGPLQLWFLSTAQMNTVRCS